jgi:uncharacterized protein HemX
MSPTDNSQSDIAALKNQVFTLLVALIVLTGTFTVYLYRQVSLTNKDIAQANQMSARLSQNQQVIETFVGQLVGYSQRHPEFQPVLKKYGIVPNPNSPVPAAPKK